MDLVRQHVPASTLSTRGGTELAFKLPRDESHSFAPLLSELEGRKAELGVLSCGLSVTTLEEVFLKVSAGSEAAMDQKQAAARSQPQSVSAETHADVHTSVHPQCVMLELIVMFTLAYTPSL